MSELTAVDVLRNHQKQCDFDGVEVQVSRQALDETLDKLESLQAENAALRVKLDLFREATCANCGAGPSTPGKEQKG